jgi:hypothetical protein
MGLLDCWAELDIGILVSVDRVNLWRDWWEARGLTRNLIVTAHCTWPVFQQKTDGMSMSKSDIDYLFTGKFDYVGFSYTGRHALIVHDWLFTRHMEAMKAYSIRTHGWGMTTGHAFFRQRWYSVDSSSWAGFGRWGLVYRFDPVSQLCKPFGKIEAPTRGEVDRARLEAIKKAGMMEIAEDLGISDGVRSMDPWTIDILNMTQWIRMQHIRDDDLRMAYWVGPAEMKAATRAMREKNGLPTPSSGRLLVQHRDGTTTEIDPDDAGAEEAPPAPQEDLERRPGLTTGEVTDLAQRVDSAVEAATWSSRGLDLDKVPLQMSVGRFCNNCVIRDKCHAYKEDAACSLSVVQVEQSIPLMAKNAGRMLLALQFERVQHAAMVERVNGGHYDPVLTKAMLDSLELAQRVQDLDGKQGPPPPEKKSLLASLFGDDK